MKKKILYPILGGFISVFVGYIAVRISDYLSGIFYKILANTVGFPFLLGLYLTEKWYKGGDGFMIAFFIIFLLYFLIGVIITLAIQIILPKLKR